MDKINKVENIIIKLDNLSSKFCKVHFGNICYASLCLLIFVSIFILRIGTDLQSHIRILVKYLDAGSFPFPPLYYLFVYIFAFFQKNSISLAIGSIIVLSIASFFKYKFTVAYFQDNLSNKTIEKGFYIFFLMFFSPVISLWNINSYWYLGKFTSLIWHNSTTIFVFPLCIYLFLITLKHIEHFSKKSFIHILIASVIIALSKPSFLFAFIPAFPLITIYNNKKIDKIFLYNTSISVLLFSFIILQKYIIYDVGALDNIIYGSLQSNVIIAPFKPWLHYAKYPFSALATSFLFPVVFISFYFKRLFKDTHFVFSLSLISFSIFVFLTFAESGPRMYHLNFYWQIPVSLFLMIMVLVKHLYLLLKENPKNNAVNGWNFKSVKIQTIRYFYYLHVLSGIAYTMRFLLMRTYG